MVENLALNHSVFQLLYRYVKRKFIQDSFFVSISGCNPDLLTFIEKNIEKNVDDIYVVALTALRLNFTFDNIVKLRNDKNIKKIIVFSNTSLQNIESLKDFTNIYQNDLEYTVLWPILKDLFLMDIAKTSELLDETKTFIENVISEINPELSDLVKYLLKCNESYLIYNNDVPFSLNSNLYILGIWSSLSQNFLSKRVLKRISGNSAPSLIQKKLNSPKNIEKLKYFSKSLANQYSHFPHSNTQKEIIRRMFYDREYTEAFRNVAFEQMEDILKYNLRKDVDSITEADTFYTYENIFHMYLTVLAGKKNIVIEDYQIDDAEKELTLKTDDKSDGEEIDVEQSISYSYIEMNSIQTKSLSVSFKKTLEKIDQFKGVFLPDSNSEIELHMNCSNLNIGNREKQILEESLKDYLTKRKFFILTLNNADKEIFLRLNYLLTISEPVREAFLNLMKVLYNFDEYTIKNLSSVGFLNSIIELDIIKSTSDETIYLPIYSPIILFYLQIVHNRYMDLLSDCPNLNNKILNVSEAVNQNLLNDCIRAFNNIYQLGDTSNFPYYVSYINAAQVESIKCIDFRVIRPTLIDFIQQFPYKHKMKLFIFGEVDVNSLQLCLKNILLNSTNSCLQKIQITIGSKDQKKIHYLLSTLLERNENLSIDCRLEPVNEITKEALSHITDENDIVIFLDSCNMYRKEYFRERKTGDIASIIRYRSFEKEKTALPSSGADFPIVPYAINALLNASLNDKLQEGEWDRHQLDMNLFNNISSVISEQNRPDRKVVMVFSDPSVDNQILNNQHVITVYEETIMGMEKNAKVLVLGIKHHQTNSLLIRNKSMHNRILIPLKEFCNSLDCDIDSLFSDIEEDRSVMLQVCYDNFPNTIGIAFDINEAEVSPIFHDQYLKRVFIPSHYIDEFYKRKIITLFMQYAHNLEDLLFIHFYERIICKGIVNRDWIDYESPINVSSLNKNYLFRILNFLDNEALSERTTKEFYGLLSTSDIKSDELHYLLELVNEAPYASDSYLKSNLIQYLAEEK